METISHGVLKSSDDDLVWVSGSPTVTMFAVEVRDGYDRIVPITKNEVSFTVSGSGQLIIVGNGQPTDEESDKDTLRKVFSGL